MRRKFQKEPFFILSLRQYERVFKCIPKDSLPLSHEQLSTWRNDGGREIAGQTEGTELHRGGHTAVHASDWPKPGLSRKFIGRVDASVGWR